MIDGAVWGACPACAVDYPNPEAVSLSTQTLSPTPAAPAPSATRKKFAEAKRPDFKVIQPEITHTGALIQELPKGLPKSTQSLCPECVKVIPALLFEEA